MRLPTPSFRLVEWSVAAVAVAGTLIYGLLTLIPVLLEHTSPDALDRLNSMNSILAATLCALRAWRSGRDRTAWLLIAAGFLLYAAGDVVYLLHVQYLDPLPTPSSADLLWLALFPLAYAGIALLLRKRVVGLSKSSWLDGLLGGTGTAALAVTFAFGPVLAETGGTPAEVATLISFIAGDLLLFGLIVGALSMLGMALTRSWLLLALGLLTFALGDTVYLVQVTDDTYELGTLLDNSWVIGTLLVAFAAGPSDKLDRARSAGLAALAIPLLFAGASLFVLARAAHSDISGLGADLAVATLALSLVRLAVAHRELRGLAHHRALARTDELTGLPNRRAFGELLEAAMSKAGRHGHESVALLLIDLDRFKEVNDSLGHATGDELLRAAGQRMSQQLRRADTLSRWGGDEFAVLLPGVDAAGAIEAAESIGETLAQPIRLGGVTLQLGGSIGIAVYPDHSLDSAELVRQADVAMYEAKRNSDTWRMYAADDDGYSRERLQTLEDLRAAVRTGEQLVLHYQPKVLLGSHETVGVEALVRWQHPTRGLLYPDAFLPLVEASGLMRDLTVCVLREAVHQAAMWRRDGLELPVAVNLSASSVVDADLPALLAGFLDEADLPASLLEVEITEDFLLSDRVRAHDVLTRIRELGILVSIDDYGTGYSSLAYLRDLPVDVLKLDRSFVFPMSDDPTAAAIVRSTIALAHSLGMQMVAEGVEDEAAWRGLQEYGCDQAQGYFFSRPLPAPKLLEWLHAQDHAAGAPAVPMSAAAPISTGGQAPTQLAVRSNDVPAAAIATQEDGDQFLVKPEYSPVRLIQLLPEQRDAQSAGHQSPGHPVQASSS